MKETCCMQQLKDTRLFTVERGEGHPIIVIHGGPGLDHHYFGSYLDALCNEFKLIFIDLRGHGQSDPVSIESLTLEKHAEDIHELVKALRLEKYAIYSHSYGAFVALKYAIEYPDSPSQVILSAGSPSSAFLANDFAGFAAMIAADQIADVGEKSMMDHDRTEAIPATDPIKAAFMKVLPYYFHDKKDPRILDFHGVLDRMIFKAENNAKFSEDLGDFDYCNDLGNIKTHVLILAGDSDYVCRPCDSEYMHEKIKGSKLVILEKAGHFMFIEQQEAHNETVRQFLKRWIFA